jgi:hypothetical protein
MDCGRIEFYDGRIMELGVVKWDSLEPAVLPVIWSRRPNQRAPLLPKLSFIEISVRDFHLLAVYPWNNVWKILKRFSSNIKSFTINARADHDESDDPPPDLDMPKPHFSHLKPT